MKSIEQFFPAHVVEAIGASLMHSMWQFAGLALLLILVLALVPQRAARLRYGFAIATLGLMLAMPFATYSFLHESPALESSYSGTETQFASFSMPQNFIQQAPVALSISEKVSAFFQQNAYLLLGIWLIGVGILSLRFLGSNLVLRRLKKSGLQEVPLELLTRFEELMKQVGVRKQVKLHFSKLVDSPVVIGAFKPIVLLPIGLLSGLSMAQVECILIHELAHIRRWDYLVNMLQSIAEILFFYHPATWWVNRLIRQERENCCDEIVVALNGNKVQYAHALLNLEVLRQKPASLAMAANGGNLLQRIQRITGGNIVKKQRFHLKGFLFGLLTLVCIGLVATQSHTVIKAAMPFLAADVEVENDELPSSPQNGTSQNLTSSKKEKANLGDLKTTTMTLDTPTTKVVMKDGDEEIELYFKHNGEVSSGTRNGKPIPEDELAQYGSQTQRFFSAAPPAAPQIPSNLNSAGKFPPLPPMPAIGNIPAIPPLPTIGAMPPMPPMPAFDNNSDPKEREKRMKEFEKEMEAWGESFGKQFEGGDWEAFGKDMEAWGEDFAKSFESADWEGFGENVGQWAQAFVGIRDVDSPEAKELQNAIEEKRAKFDKAKSEKERDKIEAELDQMTQRLDEMQGAGFEQKMESFGAEMEAWAEQFAKRMEVITEIEMEEDLANTRRLDQEAELEARQEAEKADFATRAIGEALVRDGLIKKASNYKLKIDKNELILNGKKQNAETHAKYLKIVSEKMGIDIKGKGATISLNTN